MLDPGPVAVGDQAADCRTDPDEWQQPAGQLGGKAFRRGADVGPGRQQSSFNKLRVFRLAVDEVLQQFVEGTRPTFVIEPRVVEKHLVVQLRGAFCRRQVDRQMTEFTQVVPDITGASALLLKSGATG